jgi:hypothetical protein
MATSYVARTGGLFTLVLGLLVLLGPAMTAQAQPLDTAFTYQGQLQQDGAPVDDTCDFRFLLYDQPTGGSQIGNTQTISDVQVVAGYFDVALDFGSSVFDGAPRYLDIAVRCGAETNFSVFGERACRTGALERPDRRARGPGRRRRRHDVQRGYGPDAE